MNTSKPRRAIKRAKKEENRQRLMALRAELTMLYDGRPPVHLLRLNHHQTREVIENYHRAQELHKDYRRTWGTFPGVAP